MNTGDPRGKHSRNEGSTPSKQGAAGRPANASNQNKTQVIPEINVPRGTARADKTTALPRTPQPGASSPYQAGGQWNAGSYRYAGADSVYPGAGPAVYGAAAGFGGSAAPGMMKPVDIEAADRARKKRHRRAALIIVGILVAMYLIGVAVFSNIFMPRTTIGNLDASLKTSAVVEQELDQEVAKYNLTVTNANGFSYQANAQETGMNLDSAAVVKAMHKHQNPWAWPISLVVGSHDETSLFITSYNETGLESQVRQAVEAYNETATAPQDATIVYDSAKNVFTVQPEKAGTQLDVDAVVAAVDQAVLDLKSTLTLTDDQLVKPTRVSTDATLMAAANTATSMVAADIKITLNGKTMGKLDADELSDMIELDDDGNVTMDENGLSNWVSNFASSVDTVGTTRTYARPDGKTITVSGGTYGWQVDQSSLLSTLESDVAAGSRTSIDIPWHLNAVDYNGLGTADWGKRYADVDLSEQHARFYDESGNLVWESDIVSGDGNDPNKATPEGVYYIVRKATNETLKTYDSPTESHETVVRYWMPFVGDLDAFHDASWQTSFGGTRYLDGYGSHGCVNLPVSAAAELYDLIQESDPVVVHW
jgi:hypothetical protein